MKAKAKAKEKELNIADKRLRHAVVSELDYEPQVKSTHIGVIVDNGVVALTGFVDSYREKIAAEKAVQRVIGVKAVANDIEVKPLLAHTDTDIAKNIIDIYQNNLAVPAEKIKVTVKDGHVVLEGKVDWNFQKIAAQKAIRDLPGIKGIFNNLSIFPEVSPLHVTNKIEEALKRNAEIDAKHILVETFGHNVTLKGTVRSWAEKKQAEYAAWSAPGVTEVNNLLEVLPISPSREDYLDG